MAQRGDHHRGHGRTVLSLSHDGAFSAGQRDGAELLEELPPRAFLLAVSEYENENDENNDEEQTGQQWQDNEERVGGGARADLDVNRVRRRRGVAFVRDGGVSLCGITVTRPGSAPRSPPVTPAVGVVPPATVCLRPVLRLVLVLV